MTGDQADSLELCPGCGDAHPAGRGPTHAYIGASAGCWARYGELLAAEFSRWDGLTHGLSVDAYAAQHPGTPGRRQAQSVTVHLMALCEYFERGARAAERLVAIRRAGVAAAPHEWLEPPFPLGELTIASVDPSVDREPYAAAIRAWAGSVWAAWAPHHDRVRGLLDLIGGR